MFACPNCGSANPPEQPSCSVCGTIFRAPQPPPAAAPGALQQTLVGHLSPAELAAQSRAPVKPKQTLLGFGPQITASPPVPGPEPAPPAGPLPGAAPSPAARPQGRTVLGIGVPPELLRADAPGAAGGVKHTALGIGPEAAAPPPGAPAGPPMADPGNAPNKRTILGVARPGIAPLNPGVAKAVVPPDAYVVGPVDLAPPLAREGATLPLPDLDEPVRLKPRSRLAAFVWLALAAGVLLGLGLLAWALWRGGPTLQARLDMDSNGREQLLLECADCEDGTTAELDGQSARFAAHKATLPLARSLAIGENTLALTLTPSSGKSSTVELQVPLQYRVRGDLKTLAEPTPKIRVFVEAEPGTRVEIDGAPVQLAADGKGQHTIDVSRELTGPSPNVARLEKKLAYLLVPPGRDPVRGDLAVQIGIVPLVVDAPGDEVITDRPEFMLSGRSHRGANLSVAGRPITIDTHGGFAQLMSVSTTGETTVVLRADAPAMAPRLFPIRVKRVASLATEAQRLAGGALDSYAALERAAPNDGARVALQGRLSEARVDNHRSILLLEMDKGCSREPCLVRVMYGLAPTARKGQTARVYGRLVGRVPGLTAGSTIPEVRADIVLIGP